MSTSTGEYLTIGDASRRTGLSVHALRFYEQEGLLIEPLVRTAAGHRAFSERDLRWLGICDTLRGTGMPIAELRRYVAAARLGPDTVDDRQALLEAHEARVREQLAELQRSLAVISAKVEQYGRRVIAGSADRSWAEQDCEVESDGTRDGLEPSHRRA